MNNSKDTLPKNGEGGYVFISHSHYDIKKVRTIRNILEENGFEPLCFYLKCLTDDDEVDDLIKREIDSRDIFLYVESKNSKDSKWVNKERDYINKTDGKTIYKINIDEDVDIKEKTLKMLNKTRVFISYSHKDQPYFEKLKEKLIVKDLKVFDESDLQAGGDLYYSLIPQRIKDACQSGCFVVICSSDSMESKFVQSEVVLACKYPSSLVIPIVIGDCEFSGALEYLLITKNFIQIDDLDSDKQFDDAVEAIRFALKNKNEKF